MFKAPANPYLVPFDGRFKLAKMPNEPPEGTPKKRKLKQSLAEVVDEIRALQRILYAHDHHALLLVFQAMDAAGKDGTIRAVLSGVNPAGCQVFSFKQPTAEELDHDFLWRTTRRLPERGRIGVFNRSYYEEVLVVRVHPEYLLRQNLPNVDLGKNGRGDEIFAQRFESIRDHELHLARNGTVILKFFLNVSKAEQKARFLSRLDEPEKNWKFSTSDVAERGHWDAYQAAYQDALAETSKPWAPWYSIPADNKPFMRLTVASLILDTLRSLDLRYPKADKKDIARFGEMRQILDDE